MYCNPQPLEAPSLTEAFLTIAQRVSLPCRMPFLARLHPNGPAANEVISLHRPAYNTFSHQTLDYCPFARSTLAQSQGRGLGFCGNVKFVSNVAFH